MMATIRKYGRYIAVLFLLNFLFSLVSPSMAFALTSGPTSPEFSNFEPVTTTDMVNLFSGDLVYNLPAVQIPGPDGGGYALSLSYHSGSGPETEASWVGHGWTLNPGAINRRVNGYPDDYNGADVEIYNKTLPNWTAISQTSLSWEIWAQNLGLNLSMNNRFNSYMGFSNTVGLGISANGAANLGISYNGVDATLNVSVNPIKILTNKIKKHRRKQQVIANEIAKTAGVFGGVIRAVAAARYSVVSGNVGLSSYGISSLAHSTQPMTNKEYHGLSLSFAASLMGALIPMGGPQVGLEGGFNIQVNDYKDGKYAYGYLHTQHDGLRLLPEDRYTDAFPEGDPDFINDRILDDFAVEKQSQYNKRNRNIGIPYSTPDNFVLTGEGLGGGFRAYRGDVGHYVPNTSKSESRSYRAGVEFQLGVTNGVGLNLGFGEGDFEVKDEWNKGGWLQGINGESDIYKFTESPEKFMRFTNDLGGEVTYNNTNIHAESATIDDKNNIPRLRTNIERNLVESKKMSSSIFYHTQGNYESSPNDAFNKNVNTNDIFSDNNLPDESIREISILKEDGSNYVYGVPVYTKNQIDVSIGRKSATIHNNYLMTQNIDSETTDLTANETAVIGTKKTTPYANTYLLTQITGSNYFDRNSDGPDESDYGAWTKFKYRKKYGANSTGNEWYQHRTPYSGLSYSANSLTNKDDDMGFFSRGEKEVYYAKCVETKTHIALFITNRTEPDDFNDELTGYLSNYDASIQTQIREKYLTGSDINLGLNRLDAMDAAGNATGALDIKGNNASEKLEKIVLFSKNRLDRPVKVVNFEYNNSLVRNTPNNNNSNWPNNPANNDNYQNSGKLTLKKVWFEYEGISNAKISPYTFHYEYFNNYPNEVLSKYGDKLNEYTGFSESEQNPDYEAYLLDPWGNINYDAKNRTEKYQPWLYQGNRDKKFDPAAWQLKRISLPSGGEIHVQYEQKDYQFIQNRKAMSMVSISPTYNAITGGYPINLEDIGLVPGAYDNYEDYERDVNEIITWLKTLRDNAGSDYNMLFFKFLYGLRNGSTGSLSTGNADYISGYTSVKSVSPEIAENGNGQPYTITVTLGKNGSDKDHPFDFAQAYKLTNNKAARPDITNLFSELDVSIKNRYMQESDIDSPLAWETVKNFLFSIGATGFLGVLGNVQALFESSNIGKINPELSYFKIINPRVKKGGGIRVKRLLMYDEGFNGISGSASIYGNEYYYELEDGSSSGVATNEPAGMREENALVGYLSRGKKSAFENLFYGRDRSAEEGPLGENVLPSASVGHSRVIVENIHKGRTGTGHVVYDYYTAKDYHFDKRYSVGDLAGRQAFESTELNKDQDDLIIPTGVFNYTKKHSFATQGFSFAITNMHGQQKKITSYGGEYHSSIKYMTAYEKFEYFEPGEQVEMIEFNNSSSPNQSTYSTGLYNPGKEMDITMQLNSVKDINWNVGFEVDLGALVLCPLFAVGITVDIDNSAVSTHAITKVINYPVILKKKTSMQDNIKHVVENKYFDKYTGKVVVTKSYDEYDGLELGTTPNHNGAYYSTDIKASWFYPEMGPKWEDPDNNKNNLTQSVGSVINYETDPFASGSGSSLTFDKVISAGLQTFRKAPASTIMTSDATYAPDFWLPWSSYTIKGAAVEGSNTFDKGWLDGQLGINLYSGTTSNYFQWPGDHVTETEQTGPWLRTTTVNKYSTAGLPLEEKNAMNIYSSAKYGYQDQLPVLVAQNTKYEWVYSFDFEEDDDYPGFTLDSETAHSGYQSIMTNNLQFQNLSIDLTDYQNNDIPVEEQNTLLLVKFWIKTDATVEETNITLNGTTNAEFEARSGEWALYKAIMDGSSPINSISFAASTAGGETVWFDDVRIQPLDTEMKTFVYDKATYRLLAEFDNQHFGLYYQYNDEGKLVRKIIETERGMFTVQEKQYNLKKQSRPE